MKILVIGDVHGSDFWKRHVEENKGRVDKVLFIGDYFDSFDITDQKKIFKNFEEIIDLHETLDIPVTTLVGNHDFHYSKFCLGRYSGYHEQMFIMANRIIDDMIQDGELKICEVIDDFIFSHAGVSGTWFTDISARIPGGIGELQDLFVCSPGIVNFVDDQRTKSRYGDDKHQTPIWIRPNSLINDPLGDYNQVVGHTSFDFTNVSHNTNPMVNGKKIYLVDSHQREAFIIDTKTGESEILR